MTRLDKCWPSVIRGLRSSYNIQNDFGQLVCCCQIWHMVRVQLLYVHFSARRDPDVVDVVQLHCWRDDPILFAEDVGRGDVLVRSIGKGTRKAESRMLRRSSRPSKGPFLWPDIIHALGREGGIGKSHESMLSKSASRCEAG